MEEKPTFFLSTRGGKKLSFKGYTYGKDRESADSCKIYWKCDDRKCKGRLITDSSDSVLKLTEHNMHGPDYASSVIQQSVARLKIAASVSQEAPAKLINTELSKDLPPEYRGYWPKESAVKRTIQRQRRKVMPDIPKSLDELTIPEDWQKSGKGDQWLLCDTHYGSDRLLIFCTDTNLRHLCRSTVWYGDGTFSVAPQHFYQLYTIHGVVMGELLPLMFCILTKKNRVTYIEMFSSIQTEAEKRGLRIHMAQFRVDFEDSCIKAVRVVFPNTVVECCFFHFAQAHFRKIGDLGLRPTYIENEDFAISMRMFTALAFVPIEHLHAAFSELCESITETAHGFIPYMEDTYVGRYSFKSRQKPDGSLVSHQ